MDPWLAVRVLFLASFTTLLQLNKAQTGYDIGYYIFIKTLTSEMCMGVFFVASVGLIL